MMTQKEMLSRPDAGYYYRIDWEKKDVRGASVCLKLRYHFQKNTYIPAL